MTHRSTLTGLVRTLAAAIPAEGRLEVKLALAAHLADDAAALERLGGDDPDASFTLLSPRETYATVKPALAAALRADAELAIAAQQERHCVELPAHLLPDEPPDPEAPSRRDPFIVDDPPPGLHSELHGALADLDSAARRMDIPAVAEAAERADDLDARLTAAGTPWGSWIDPHPDR